MSESDLPGRLIHNLSLIMPVLGIGYAILTTTGTFPYNIIPVPLTGGTTHFVSFLLICISFIFHYQKLAFLYPLARLVTTLSFTVFYIHLYDALWSIQSQLIRGHGLNRVSIISVMVVFVILSKLDDNFGILDKATIWPPRLTILGIMLVFIGFTGMTLTGFWADMELLDRGGCCVDPNQNPWWLLSKIPWFFLLLPYINGTDLKAPLKLHPRVII